MNCSKNLLSSSVHKVTTGTYNFLSVLLNVAFVGALIPGLVGLSLCATTAAWVILSVKTQFINGILILKK